MISYCDSIESGTFYFTVFRVYQRAASNKEFIILNWNVAFIPCGQIGYIHLSYCLRMSHSNMKKRDEFEYGL